MNASYIKLSSFYAMYFAIAGSMVVFFPVYLQNQNYHAELIGLILAMPSLMRCLAPIFWASIFAKMQNPMAMLRWCAALSALSFLGVFFQWNWQVLAAVLGVHALFLYAILPQMEVVALGCLGQKTNEYSWIRIWGSLGFVAAVLLLGFWFTESNIQRLPSMVLVMLVILWVLMLTINTSKSLPVEGMPQAGLFKILAIPGAKSFYLSVLVFMFSHGPYYTFLTIYLKSLGYNSFEIGVFWSLGVLAEIVAFLVLPHFLKIITLRMLILSCVFLTSIRWLMLGTLADYPLWLLLAQLLHAATFGGYHAGIMQYLQQKFVCGSNQSLSQALFAACTGAGVGLGTLVSGWLWANHGGYMTFLWASIVAFLAGIILWFFFWPRIENLPLSPNNSCQPQ